MALEQAVSIIRGPEGTKVTLGIMRRGFKKARDFAILRKKIVIKSTEFKMLDEDIAYVKLNTFEKKTAPREMKKALSFAHKKNSNGLILDIRNNGGGLLSNAIDIGSMFIRNGIIVQTVDREGMREVKYSSGRILWDKPIVVLINEASASASEILAGALRDNKIATLVGSKTFGKASVQSVRRLQDDSAVLITIAKYLTPNGDDISEKGITPEIVVTIPTEEANGEETTEKTTEEKEELPEDKKKKEALKEKEEQEDIQLQKAIEVIRDIIAKTYRGI
jgi:carboxyl-terminal processing protease